jgi:hypothetical protein
LKKSSMVGPWEVVSVASVAAITEVKEDVNGGPPGRCCSCPLLWYVLVSTKKMLAVTNDPVGCWT